jgi:hypothetical protein
MRLDGAFPPLHTEVTLMLNGFGGLSVRTRFYFHIAPNKKGFTGLGEAFFIQ